MIIDQDFLWNSSIFERVQRKLTELNVPSGSNNSSNLFYTKDTCHEGLFVWSKTNHNFVFMFSTCAIGTVRLITVRFNGTEEEYSLDIVNEFRKIASEMQPYKNMENKFKINEDNSIKPILGNNTCNVTESIIKSRKSIKSLLLNFQKDN